METLQKVFIEIGIPYQVVFAIIAIVFLTEWTKTLAKNVEIYLEEKYKKEIKIFDHTKIIFLIFWSIMANICLVIGKVITWSLMPLYTFALIGVCSFCYELIIKKVQKWLEDI